MERELRLTKEEKKDLRGLCRQAYFKVGADYWNYGSPSIAWQCFAGRFMARNHKLGLMILRDWVKNQQCM